MNAPELPDVQKAGGGQVSGQPGLRGGPARIAALQIAADPVAWQQAGFDLDGDSTRVGTTRLEFAGPEAGRGIVGWSVAGLGEGPDLDGLVTGSAPMTPELAGEADESGSPVEHPLGVTGIDHVVVFTPELERTSAAFEAAGVRCRRIREVGPPESRLRQGFFRFGPVICEVVEVPADKAGPDGSARFWGLTLVAEDLDHAVAELGPLIGTPRDAVQPGRRIATIRKEAGLGLPVALITPA